MPYKSHGMGKLDFVFFCFFENDGIKNKTKNKNHENLWIKEFILWLGVPANE